MPRKARKHRVNPGYAVATWSTLDGLRVEGERWTELSRDNAWKKQTIYLVGSAPWLEIGSRYLGKGQEGVLTAKVRGKPTGISWRTSEGSPVSLVSGEAWGLPMNPDDARAELRRLEELLSWERALEPIGEAWRPSAASVAGALLRKAYPGLAQLKPRWRALARGGFHGGPQLALSGGAPEAVQLDRRRAYLEGMRAPMPEAHTYVSIKSDVRWSKLREHDGFALALVRVQTRAALPPLPVRWLGGTVWPVGKVWGTWPISWIKEAEESGQCEVLRVLDAQVCQVRPWLAPFADCIEEIEDNTLRKLIYTRAYGIFAAAKGRWEGRPANLEERETIERGLRLRWRDGREAEIEQLISAAGWAWSYTGPDPWSHMYPPTYRPDVAAFIAADNARAMTRAIASVPSSSVYLAHVDALWLTPEAAPAVEAQGGWARKGEGPLRVYGTGTYTHGARARAQGVPDVHDRPELLEELLEARQLGDLISVGEASRHWTHGGPARSSEARSMPGEIRQGSAVAHVPTWDRAAWSGGDWRARELEGKPLSAAARMLTIDPAREARKAAEEQERWTSERRLLEDARWLHEEGADWREAVRVAIRREHGPGADDDYNPEESGGETPF